MQKILVIGAGMVGSAIAVDLSKLFQVTSADANSDRLDRLHQQSEKIKTILLDVRDKQQLARTLNDYSLIVCAVPGFLGFETLKTIIDAGKNVVDISFFPEDAFLLDNLAREKGVTAIVDCGVAPGLDNLVLGYWNEKLKLKSFECLVGGLPKNRKWPFCYKAPFSPVDVIEEYTRPARYVENNAVITREPLTDCEYVEFDNIGTLEAFNSDGLRSIIKTMAHIPDMKEKTLRYPGHAEYINVLRQSGFFSNEKIKINNTEITPLEFSSKILFNEWKPGEDEPEFTVMRITLRGEDRSGTAKQVVYDLYDEFDPETKTSSMARTTGYTASAATTLLAKGLFNGKGIFPPEVIGKNENCFLHVINYIGERNIKFRVTETDI